MVKDSIALFYKDGSSDKEYHAYINEVDGGCTVTFAYGRRGSALTPGTKTTAPVAYDAAKKIFDKLVAEKTSKGYTPSGDGKIFVATDNADRVSGLTPQLLNPITEEDAVKYLNDDAWGIQEKHDGKRIMVKIERDKSLTGSNRKGLTVSMPQDLVYRLIQWHTSEIDGELIGDTYCVFDCLHLNDDNLRNLSYQERYERLEIIVKSMSYLDDITSQTRIRLSPLVTGKAAKLAFYNDLKARHAEGVVFKRLDAKSVPGRPASGGNQLKCKFYETCTCQVLNVNTQRSVQLAMSDGKDVGNVTIPPNKDIPKVGDLVEVRYLYINKGDKSKLYQPTYLMVRDDLNSADDRSSLKTKPDGEDDE